MRATGLQYANQRYKVGGFDIHVQISGDQDYIKIIGGECLFNMDSGLVDLVSIIKNRTDASTPGILHRAGEAISYCGPFTKVTAKSGYVRDDESVTGQVAGSIKHAGGFVGEVPADATAARSFSPKTIFDETVHPPVFRTETNDEDLEDKKMSAFACPASMFTGRCRLYVQSMYGRFMYADNRIDKETGAAVSAGKKIEQISASINNPPSIAIAPYKGPDDIDEDLEAVVINVNTGVFLDTETGKHWLMRVELGKLVIYPLISSTCGESLRGYLKADSRLASRMTEQDLHHIEAYILSQCAPYHTHRITLAVGTTSTYSMGYGWHWNWSGTAADIVVNLSQPYGDGFCLRSTHYRIVVSHFTEHAVTSFSVEHRAIEGPTDWAAPRAYWCIAEPSWSNMEPDTDKPPVYGFIKTVQSDAPMILGEGFFYVFYAKDVAKVCRSQVGKIDPTTLSISASEGFLAPDGSITGSTLGLEDGYWERFEPIAERNFCEFSCDSEKTGIICMPYNAYEAKITVTGKSLNGTIDPDPATFRPEEPYDAFGNPTYAWYSFWGSNYYDYGMPNGSPHGWARAGPIDSSKVVCAANVDFTYTSTNYLSGKSGYADAVVPFYDSEAIYLRGIKLVLNDYTYHRVARLTGNDYVQYEYGWTGMGGSIFGPYISYRFGGWTATSTISDDLTIPPPGDPIKESGMEKLICRTGVVEAQYSGWAAFHETPLEDRVLPGNLVARVSTSFTDPVIIGATAAPVGTTADLAAKSYPALVGWV